MFIVLLADADPTPEETMRAIRFGLILIVTIGIIGILLIVAMLAAWRNFHRRIGEIEAQRNEARAAVEHADAWAEASERVEYKPSPIAPEQDDDEDDDSDLYGKDWEPGDDDENPDDDRSW